MAPPLDIVPNAFATWQKNPEQSIEGTLNGSRYRARIAIPNYGERIAAHYGRALGRIHIPFSYRHFGILVEFETPVELQVYDEDRVLDARLRTLMERFGPVMFRNAYLPERERAGGQRNIFPSLSFHLDRGATQADCYSLFCRDPFDAQQREPRSSSTLILANVAAYLQALKEGQEEHDFRALYQLFGEEDITSLFGKTLIDQSWSAPEGTGEITILDNRTVLHASYYAREIDKGYPIGVRYLF